MNQALFSGKDFHEGAVFHYFFDIAPVYFAHFHIFRNRTYLFNRAINRFLANCRDRDRPIVFDIDFGARILGNGLNVLPARPDDTADFIDINRDKDNARRVR